jgi:hypothetical protein
MRAYLNVAVQGADVPTTLQGISRAVFQHRQFGEVVAFQAGKVGV